MVESRSRMPSDPWEHRFNGGSSWKGDWHGLWNDENWAEDGFPTFFQPRRPASQTIEGYYARCYSGTANCVGVKDGEVYYYDGRSILRVGTLADLMVAVR